VRPTCFKYRRSKQVLLFVGSLVLSLLVAEICLRLLLPRSDGKLQTKIQMADGRQDRAMLPNSVGYRIGRKVTVNAAGYRGRLYSKTKPKETTRIYGVR
jgi:hypothetical protein